MLMAILQTHPFCERTTIFETKEFSSDQFFIALRTDHPQG
jgi:hypothetical protein